MNEKTLLCALSVVYHSSKMLRFYKLVSFEKNFCLKIFIEKSASKLNILSKRHFSVTKSETTVLKIPKYIRIAEEENLNLDDLLTKPQDKEEIEKVFREIAQGDAEIEKRLQLLLYEVMLILEEDGKAPKNLKKNDWEYLLKLNSLSKRNKYLNFLYKTEKKRESEKIREKLRKREIQSTEKLSENIQHLYYGLSGYSMFLRLYESDLFVVQDLRALTNKLFASPILFDCSYKEYMNVANSKNCAQQLAFSYGLNRMHPYPCTLQLVNLKKDDPLMEYLKLRLPSIQDSRFSLEIFEKSYLDLYEKERLVYLTPHTKNDLVTINPNDIFIIGAFVDKGNGIPVSLAKAKEEGLRMAKLPIDKYLLWCKGTKSLTLNNVLNILLDMRYYNNWGKAFKSIPSRNLQP